MTNETCGNIHDRTIKISFKFNHFKFSLQKILLIIKKKLYHSKDEISEGNNIIYFDFKDKFVKLLSYSNKSICSNVFGTNVKNWSIE